MGMASRFIKRVAAGTSYTEAIRVAGFSRGSFQLPLVFSVNEDEEESSSSSSASEPSSGSSESSSSSASSSISTSSSSSQSESSSSPSSISTSSASESSSSSSAPLATIDFQVRNVPTNKDLQEWGQDENDWPWKTPLDATGSAAVSQIADITGGDCYQFPAAVFDFDEVRIVFGATQGDNRPISITMAG